MNLALFAQLVLRASAAGEVVCHQHRALLGLQELEQLGARHQQLAAQCPARFEFTALNEPVHAEVIDAKQVSGFLNGIGQPPGLRRLFRVFGGLRW